MKAALGIQESLPTESGVDRIQSPFTSISCFIHSLELHRGRLKGLVQRKVGPHLRSKISPSDIVQETFTIAIRSAEKCRGRSKAERSAWLRGILHNVLRATIRRLFQRADAEVHDNQLMEGAIDPGTSPSAIAGQNEDRERLASALQKLSARDHQILVARYWDHQSYEQIAEQLEITVEAARRARARAILRLQQVMDRGGTTS